MSICSQGEENIFKTSIFFTEKVAVVLSKFHNAEIHFHTKYRPL